jgi:tetratricopeptide (TPR) repeat protein
MERAVLESRRTLLVLTPSYLQSDWTTFESLILQTGDPVNRKLSLIPLLRESCEIPRRLGIFNYADFTQEEDWDRLLAALGASTRKEPATPTRADWDLVHPYGMPPNFTGRLAERKMLSDWLEGEGPALLVLRALGGFGKSALVWYWLLHDVDPTQWPRTVWWCFYEPDASFERFLTSTLRYFGADPRPLGPREQVEELFTVLRRPGTLLVLDGFERELRAFSGMGGAYQGDMESIGQYGDNRDCVNLTAEIFLRGVTSLPDLKGRVLLTTRLRPRMLETHSGELLVGCKEKMLMALEPKDAIDFFQAEGIRGHRGEIRTACEPYGFHPLSLRLLAGLILRDVHMPGDIAAARKLDVSGDLVQRRHHVLEQAYESLTPARQKLLSRIACFRGAVGYEAITAASREGSSKKLDESLLDLVGRALLNHDVSNRRFDLHPIIRRYSYDRLGSEEQQATHSVLSEYFARVEQPRTIQKIADLTPVVELFLHTLKAGKCDEAFGIFRNRISRETYYQLGAYRLSIELLQALLPASTEDTSFPKLSSQTEQAWALNELANSYSLTGQPLRAESLFKLCNELHKKSGAKEDAVISLQNLAYMAQIPIGALRSAEDKLLQSISLCRNLEIRNGGYWEAVGQASLARVLGFRGDYAEARQALARALELFQSLWSFQGEAVTRADQSFLHLLLARAGVKSQLTQALAAAGESLQLANETALREHPYPHDFVRAHWLLGTSFRELGMLSDSEHHLSKALIQCRRMDMIYKEANILIDLGHLRRRIAQLDVDDNHLDTAREHAAEARRLATCDGPPDYTYKVAYDEAGALLERLRG